MNDAPGQVDPRLRPGGGGDLDYVDLPDPVLPCVEHGDAPAGAVTDSVQQPRRSNQAAMLGVTEPS